jgi:Protein of unknown function (DUF2281)
MTAKTSNSVLMPESVMTDLELLSKEQRQQVFDFVAFLAQQRTAVAQKSAQSKQERIFGQYKGRISMSADFDEPLLDCS